MLLFNAAAAHKCKDHKADNRDRVGNRRGEVRIESSCRELDAERLRKAENQAGEHAAEALAGAHRLRRKRDEAASCDHVEAPALCVGHRHERAAEASHETRVGNRGILDFQHRHADRRCRVRVFAHGADVHAEARLIEHDGR